MPVILISRGTMSGVHLMVDCLKCDLPGIPCYSREDLEEIVNRHGRLATRTVEKLAHASSAYDQFSELRWPYIVLMRKALLEELCSDNAIYHGYSGQLLLPVIRFIITESSISRLITISICRPLSVSDLSSSTA